MVHDHPVVLEKLFQIQEDFFLIQNAFYIHFNFSYELGVFGKLGLINVPINFPGISNLSELHDL